MDLKKAFHVLKPPATAPELGALKAAYGSLPASYLDFLGLSNGAEWSMHDKDGDCLALWSAKEIPELNEAYQVGRWVPDLLVIGSNGGDDAVGLDRAASDEPENWPVVRVGFGNLDRADFRRLATGFREWQEGGFRLR